MSERMMAEGVPRACRPYTLVEILTVIAVVSILLGISLPAFEKLAKGQGVDLAARQMSAKLRGARAYAVSKGKNVALIFPNGDGTETLPEKYLNRSYRPAIVTGSQSPYTFESWIDGEKWEFLPTGTLLIDIDDTENLGSVNGFSNASEVNGVAVGDMQGVAAGATSDSMKAIVFEAPGNLDTTAYCVLNEGQRSGGSIVRTNQASPGISIGVNRFTGRISFGD